MEVAFVLCIVGIELLQQTEPNSFFLVSHFICNLYQYIQQML
jgi:hypothetical protein